MGKELRTPTSLKFTVFLALYLLCVDNSRGQAQSSKSPQRPVKLGDICGQGQGGQSCNANELTECSDNLNGTCICIKGYYQDNESPPNCHSVDNLQVLDVNVTINSSGVYLEFEQPSTWPYISFYQIQWRIKGSSVESQTQNVMTSESETIKAHIVPGPPGMYEVQILSVETASRPEHQFAITDHIQVPFGIIPPPQTVTTVSTTPAEEITSSSATDTENNATSATILSPSTTTTTTTTTTKSPEATSTLSSSATPDSVAMPEIVQELGSVCGEDYEKICNVQLKLECSDQFNGICRCQMGYYNDQRERPSCQTLDNLRVTDVNITMNISTVEIMFRQPDTSSHIASYQIWWRRDDQGDLYQKLPVSKGTDDIITTYITSGLAAGNHTIRVVSVETHSRPEAQYTKSISINVTIEGRPTKGEIFPNTTIILNQGDDLELTCTSNGIPPPRIKWHNTTSFHETSNGTLIKRNVTKDDKGRYICLATNKYGSHVEVAEVHIRYAPVDMTNQYDRSLTVSRGTTVELRCLVDAYPPPKLTWRDEYDTFLGNWGTMNVTLGEGEDMGRFYCDAQNDVGNLTIQYTVTIIPPDTCGCKNNGTCIPIPTGVNDFVCRCQPGFTGRLCETDGRIDVIFTEIVPSSYIQEKASAILTTKFQVGDFRYLNIQWMHEGKHVPIQSSRLNVSSEVNYDDGIVTSKLSIGNVQKRDAGTWVCMVSNRFNKSVAQFFFGVLPLPVLAVRPYSVSAKTGALFSLRCVITNDDFIGSEQHLNYVHWYKDGRLILGGSGFDFSYADFYNVSVLTKSNAQFGDSGEYKCCATSWGRSTCSQLTKVVVSPPETVFCQTLTDQYGIVWVSAASGTVQIQRCPDGFLGNSSRRCVKKGWQATWDPIVLVNCVREQVSEIQNEINDIITDGIQDPAEIESVVEKGLNLMENLTNVNSNMTSGDLTSAVQMMMDIATISGGSKINETKFVSVMDNILDRRNTKQWEEVNSQNEDRASNVFQAIDKLGQNVFDTLNTGESRSIVGENIEVDISKIDSKTPINFPRRTVDKSSYIVLAPQRNISKADLAYTAALYKTISSFLPTKSSNENGSVFSIQSEVLSLSMGTQPVQLNPAVSMGFQHSQKVDLNRNRLVCSYWNFTYGGWSSEGCRIKESTSIFTQCECDHLTNFAILMRPYEQTEPDTALSIISIVGCSISIVCIALTVAIFIALWRYVKTDQIVILINICVSLGLAYLVFVIGVDKTDNDALCTVIAALLQYLFLAVFFLMLAEGIHYFMSVTLVYYYLHLANDLKARNTLKWLLLQGWGIPALITAITLGVSYNSGYHNKNFCWLSVNNGVLYGFVGPALLVILINIIIICTLFRVMYATTLMSTSNTQRKASAGLRSMCTLLPILGVTWVFGILAINEQVVAIQYIFAITNSLQGLFIFVFHCLLNSKVREGFKQRLKLYESQSEASRISSSRKIHQIKMGKAKKKNQKQKQQVVLLSFNKSSEYKEHFDNVYITEEEVWSNDSLYVIDSRRESSLSNKTGSYTVSSASTERLNGHID